MITISEGGPHDVASIMPVMAEAFDATFGEAWSSAQCLAALAIPGSQLLIARKEDGVVTGFAITRWVLDEEELLMIGVKKNCQRQNIATHILKKIIENSNSYQRNRIFLEVRDGNFAKLFYDKSGFVAVGRRKGYYRGTDSSQYDAITMVLSL